MKLLDLIEKSPKEIQFNEVIKYIDEHYHFIPTTFNNGELKNEPNQNNGSCKVFAFAKLFNFNENTVLELFGDYYRKDVLQNMEGTDHQNIRNFMKYGWKGIVFFGEPLKSKTSK